MSTSRRSRARARAVWTGIGVSVLAVVVVALSFIALTQNRSVAEAGATPGAVAPSVVPAEPTAEPVEPAPSVASAVVPSRVIAVINSDEAVRTATVGCPTPSTIEVTADAGATWESFEAPSVAAVQRMTAGADAFVSLIGLAVEGCSPAYERSFSGGADWESAPDELAASWFVDPANRAGIHAPSGDRAAPCGAVVQLAAIDENSAAVLCDDGSVHATVDGGVEWLPPVTVAGVSAVTADGASYRVAVLNQDGCTGVQVVHLPVTEAGLAPGALGACLAATAAAGDVALASGENVTWVWAGDALARSDDGGATWL